LGLESLRVQALAQLFVQKAQRYFLEGCLTARLRKYHICGQANHVLGLNPHLQ
jgi:hypothetical protein